MGFVWGITLIGQRAWNWPVPLPIRILYGSALITVVVVLIIAVRERRAYRRTCWTTTGCACCLLILDALMLTTVATLATLPGWTVPIAVAASIIRMLGIARALPASLSA
jgi:hypothetical protein